MDDGDETSPVGAAAHILVIDDDRKITDALRRGLVYQGYRVDVAHSGADGLELARRWAPDVVILDILMPGLDGLEVCRRLRAGGDVPILLLTARDRIEDRVEGLADDLARTMQIRHVPPPGRLVVTLPPTNVFGAPDTFAEVADIRGGQVVARSATLGGQTLPFLVQALAAARRGQSMARVVEPEENRLHLYSVPPRSGGRVVGVIEVARALAADERLLERLRLALAWIIHENIHRIGLVADGDLAGSQSPLWTPKSALRPLQPVYRGGCSTRCGQSD